MAILTLDATDYVILGRLLRDATCSKANISRAVGIAPSAVFARIDRLRRAGVIRGFETRLDPHRLGFHTLAFIFVTERKPTRGVRTAQRLSKVTGAEEVHRIAGEDCFLVKIRARSTEELGVILDTEVNAIPTVIGTRTTIVLGTAREDVTLGGVRLQPTPLAKQRRIAAPSSVRKDRHA